MPKGSRSRKSTEKLEASQCMSSGRGVNHMISCLSTQARGVGTHGSSTYGLTHRRTRCTPTFKFQHIQTTSDQFKNVKESKERKQEVSIVFKSFRDQLLHKVLPGRPFKVRHVIEVICDRRPLEVFKKGFWSRIRARVKATTNQTLFLLLGSWIMAGGRYRALSIACLISNARMLRFKEGYVSMSLRGLAERKVARVCPYVAGQRGCIKHALYREVARKHALSFDTLSGLHVSYVGCSNPCAFVAATRHVALPDHGVGFDGQSCSCLIVGWPVGRSSPTLGVGHPSV
ncbi:hypothetical protein IGI04_002073, partial [Brassica rapa subsp. trilocularis]